MRLALVLLGGVLLPELVLRFLVLSDLPLAARLGAPLRQAALFASPQSPEHWALQARFERLPEKFLPLLHPELGYRSAEIDPATFRHADEGGLRGRRPVLLYGDSFAECVTRPENCWQGLMEASDLAQRYALLNYGVGGYGLDQAVLLMERTIDLYRALQPVVIIGVLVDDDLDRCTLSVREYPKARFELEGGELRLCPPPPATPEGVVQAPIGIRSYLWNGLLYGSGLVSAQRRERWFPEQDRVATVSELCARLVRRAHAELSARGVEHFFLLFHAQPSARSAGPFTWRETVLYRTFEDAAIPFVSSKRYVWQDAHDAGRALADYYVPATAKHGKNHFTATANRVVFEAIRAGLEGHYEPFEYLAGVAPPR